MRIEPFKIEFRIVGLAYEDDELVGEQDVLQGAMYASGFDNLPEVITNAYEKANTPGDNQ